MSNADTLSRPRSRREFGSQAGQGTLEYILILAVVVLIILGLFYQFSGAFRSYVGSYFGNYVACLLEVGDLPGVASDCDSEFPAFDIKNGKPLITSIGNGSSSSSSGSTSSSTGSSSTSTSSNSSAGKSGSSSSSSSSSSGSSETASTTGGSSRVSGGAGAGRRSSTPVGKAADAGNARGSEDDVVGISPTSTRVGSYRGQDHSRLNNMSWGYYGEEAAEEREKDKPTIAAMKRDIAENNQLKPKSVPENLERKVAAEETEDKSDYTFGGMFRILLIVLMILALIVFFGGQILQMSKSGEE